MGSAGGPSVGSDAVGLGGEGVEHQGDHLGGEVALIGSTVVYHQKGAKRSFGEGTRGAARVFGGVLGRAIHGGG